jgi:hypothetical protein
VQSDDAEVEGEETEDMESAVYSRGLACSEVHPPLLLHLESRERGRSKGAEREANLLGKKSGRRYFAIVNHTTDARRLIGVDGPFKAGYLQYQEVDAAAQDIHYAYYLQTMVPLAFSATQVAVPSIIAINY